MKNWYYILAIIMLSGITASFVLLKRRNDVEKAYSSSLENRIYALSFDSSSAQEERWLNSLSLKENGTIFRKDITLIDNTSKTSLSAYADTITEPKLIMRFSYLSCEVCIDSALSIIRKYQDSIRFENIVLWATYDNRNNLALFRNVNRIKYKTFFVPANDTVIKADTYSIPYIFVLQPHRRNLYDLFFPQKENSMRTRDYFDIVTTKYYKK
jgi:hypothetical protein